jgi:hypothetical protein
MDQERDYVATGLRRSRDRLTFTGRPTSTRAQRGPKQREAAQHKEKQLSTKRSSSAQREAAQHKEKQDNRWLSCFSLFTA